MEQRLSARDLSFDPTATDDEDDGSYSPAHYLPSPDSDPAVQAEAEEWEGTTHDRLQQALATLDTRSRDILVSRWSGDDKSTLHDLAARYNVSAERIRQIEANAIKQVTQLDDIISSPVVAARVLPGSAAIKRGLGLFDPWV